MLATNGAGLLQWSADSGTFVSAPSSGRTEESDLFLRDVLISQAGVTWVLSNRKVFLYNPVSHEEKALNTIVRSSHLLRNPVAITEDIQGEILISTRGRLIKVSPVESTIERVDLRLDDREDKQIATTLHGAENKYLYLGTDRGVLLMLDPIKYEVVRSTIPPSSDKPYISEIASINGNLVVSTDIDIFQLSLSLESAKDISNVGHGVSYKDIMTIEPDGDSIWVGTYMGLELLGFSNFQIYTTATSSIPGGVSAFEEGPDKNTWISTYNGLFLHDLRDGYHTKFGSLPGSSSLIDTRTSALERVGRSLWVGFYSGGLQIVDFPRSNFPEVGEPFLTDHFFTRIQYDSDSDSVWLSTLRNGIAKIDLSSPNRPIKWFLKGQRVLAMEIADSGEVFASSGNKLFQYAHAQDDFALLGTITPNKKKVTVEINSIAQGADGVVWLGTRDYGLYKVTLGTSVDKTEFIRVQERGIRSSAVQAIEVDDRGNLWCSTNRGLFKLDYRGRFLARFTKADGLQGNDFEHAASFKNSEGELFFGGADGYNRFHPHDIEIDQTVPEVRLTDVEFPERGNTVIWDHRDTERVILTHKDKSVTFRFSILDYTSPTQNQFRYKLDGFDAEWTEVGAASFAKYTNLPAGDYTFRVQAANPAGIWNTDGLAVTVSKSPPPWLSWWAFIIYACAFILLWWTSNRVYQSYTFRRRTEELQREKLALEIRSHDELQEQMEIQNLLVRSAYQHNSSTLSVLDTAATEALNSGPDASSDRARNWLQALSTLDRFLYYFPDNPTANLHEFTNEVLSELVEASELSPESLVTINDVSAMYIPTARASPLALIIYELLQNALQHAFVSGADAHYLYIRLVQRSATDTEGQLWVLEITDDGIGFEFDPGDLGPGLKLVYKLVNSLDGTLEVENVSGTRIRIVIPADKEDEDMDKLALSA